MYSTTTKQSTALAFHIRPLRQWYGSAELSQTRLAALAGVSIETLRAYERSRQVPAPVRSLLAISQALCVPVERLIDPRRMERLAPVVEACPTPPAGNPPSVCSDGPWILAACYRSPYLALAVVTERDIIRVSGHLLTRQKRGKQSLRRLIAAAAADYGITAVVVEPRYSALHTAAAGQGDSGLISLSIKEAKQRLLPDAERISHHRLYTHLLATYPQLRRLVRVLPATGNLVTSERWRTVQLLAVALGLAARGEPRVQRSSPAPSGAPSLT